MTNDKHKGIARESLLLKSLPAEYVDRLLAMSSWHSYDRGETLFLHGETARSIHIVISGWVKLFRVAPNGGETVVSVFTRGESFGEAVAFRSNKYPVSAEAVTACELIQIPTSALLETMRKDLDVSVSILASTFAHLHSLVDQLEQLKAQTGAQRVAEFLLEFCEGSADSCVVTLPYDKVLIAGRLGMKPESLSRAFAKLKPIGVTINRNSASIDSIEGLREFALSDPANSWNKAL
ncbi:CRP-like cAMP-binding protein [Aliiruegeria haliotis]|uniref:CRP-like cAMP-binding protein n=1 Tax=Aliiruegeria haliotis TaxID=1280846 RepID=A0A2T0RKY1_9RHOB|nr:Crp/Fnr family transcriptional regulator [Aliiruegeria haliotis]PRY21856.1 CRP-like cAMP-binding protein [Aliiruegeria haliotis]